MAFDPVANLFKTLVAVAPSPATSGLTLTVSTGDGALIAAVLSQAGTSGAVNATVYPDGSTPNVGNTPEIIRITGVAGDVITFARRAEAIVRVSTARAIAVGDAVEFSLTAKFISDIINSLIGVYAADIALVAGVTLSITHGLNTTDVLYVVQDKSTTPYTDIAVAPEYDPSAPNVLKITSNVSYPNARIVVQSGSGLQGPRGLTGTVRNRIVNPATHTTTPWVIDTDVTDIWAETALGANVSISIAPASTLADGQGLQVRVFDAGTHTMTWSASFNGGAALPLPTSSVAGKTLYCGFQYNASTSKFDLVGMMTL